MYTSIASLLTAVFIATVYYLLVLFQFPQVPLSSGYWLGAFVIIVGVIKLFVAKTDGQQSDAKVIMLAGVLLAIATYLLLYNDIQI
ncbi:hypothetical protein [Pueribacillus sp. YX66]|uniref:hypothetical protein n=1 Tax=Pueribacillus sp. YX66 TaxID=3229242 RepID=UPI00358D723B